MAKGLPHRHIRPKSKNGTATAGVIRPQFNPSDRPQWPEALYLITHNSTLGYTMEAPSDFPLPTRVAALVDSGENGGEPGVKPKPM